MTSFGLCSGNSSDALDDATIARWRAFGLTHSRYGVDGSVLFARQPSPSLFVPDPATVATLDNDLPRLHAAGLSTTLNWVWFPAWMCGGSIAYQRYETGWWRITATDASGRPTAVEYDNHGGIDPGHVSAQWVEACATWLAMRYGDFVDFWAIGNEPGGGYWPPIKANLNTTHDGPDYDAAVWRYFDEVFDPFVNGVRQVEPSAKFTGPEADGADILRRIVETESKSIISTANDLSRLTMHPYALPPSTWPQGSYDLIAEFNRVLGDDSRPRDWSEISSCGQGDMAPWLEEVLAGKHGPVPARITFGQESDITPAVAAIIKSMPTAGRVRSVVS